MLIPAQTLKHFAEEECESSLSGQREECCNPLALSAEVGALGEMVILLLISANHFIGFCSFASRTIELNYVTYPAYQI